jgi:hypothetical protein
LHEIPPVVRKRSEESSALRRLKANSIAGGFLLVKNRAHLVNACAGDAIAFASMRSIGTTFRLAEPMLPVTIKVMGMEFPRDRRSADDS